jgi:hypothetical protein
MTTIAAANSEFLVDVAIVFAFYSSCVNELVQSSQLTHLKDGGSPSSSPERGERLRSEAAKRPSDAGTEDLCPHNATNTERLLVVSTLCLKVSDQCAD